MELMSTSGRRPFNALPAPRLFSVCRPLFGAKISGRWLNSWTASRDDLLSLLLEQAGLRLEELGEMAPSSDGQFGKNVAITSLSDICWKRQACCKRQ